MKRPLAYITAAWCGSDHENTKLAAQYCRTVYEAGFSPICPTLYQPLFLNDAVPEEHKSGIDMGRDLLRRSHSVSVGKRTQPPAGSSSYQKAKGEMPPANRVGKGSVGSPKLFRNAVSVRSLADARIRKH